MSRYPGLYFDIGKKARDVLHKDYAQQPPIHFNYRFLDWNLDLSCQVEEIVPGVRGLFNCTIPDSGKVELQHLNKYSGFSGSVGLLGDPEKGYNPVANISGLIGTRILTLGANLAYDLSTRAISNLNAGLSLSSPYLVASLTLHDNFENVKASCYFEVNPLTKTAIAAEVKYDLLDNETTGVTVGAQHALFPCTLLKARLNSYGKVSALIRQKLGNKFAITVAGELNLNEKDKEKFPKVGVSMALR
ncbi:mitochondrial outer membrane protein porin of 36 kDa-like isoform X2 [Abrus precatorius]|uniref:Mitochondrial outer membrane protein porin of 36 kDa-like isoform X2 n=1 Tax=Abrus precatorius TaxID=3816 RepID=A0A8B8K829_ABRPR|nr:mitochondrial outer membrane protein porin of 36 kDa-like isoform X2 [Abrus precatorius]